MEKEGDTVMWHDRESLPSSRLHKTASFECSEYRNVCAVFSILRVIFCVLVSFQTTINKHCNLGGRQSSAHYNLLFHHATGNCGPLRTSLFTRQKKNFLGEIPKPSSSSKIFQGGEILNFHMKYDNLNNYYRCFPIERTLFNFKVK